MSVGTSLVRRSTVKTSEDSLETVPEYAFNEHILIPITMFDAGDGQFERKVVTLGLVGAMIGAVPAHCGEATRSRVTLPILS